MKVNSASGGGSGGGSARGGSAGGSSSLCSPFGVPRVSKDSSSEFEFDTQSLLAYSLEYGKEARPNHKDGCKQGESS